MSVEGRDISIPCSVPIVPFKALSIYSSPSSPSNTLLHRDVGSARGSDYMFIAYLARIAFSLCDSPLQDSFDGLIDSVPPPEYENVAVSTLLCFLQHG